VSRGRAVGVAVGVLLAAGFACDRGTSRPGTGEPVLSPRAEREAPRFARRFLPVGDAWIPEQRVPTAPQKKPRMVIWELTRFPGPGGGDPPPSAAQRARAREFAERCERAARAHGWFDFQQGMADGFRLLYGDRRHYYNESFVFDDALLDPERPEFLMYYGTPEGQKLAGYMFYARRPDERGPQFGGPLTVWHYHVWTQTMCLLRGLLSVGEADEDGRCVRGVPTHRSPEMIHVWFFDHPGGRYATSMHLDPQQLAALIERDRQRADRAVRGRPGHHSQAALPGEG